MITGELKNKVDSIWDTIWTGGITSPITVLEQVTYLMFMKLLDDNQLKAEAGANALGIQLKKKVFGDGVCVISENPHVETEYRNLRWNVFHNFEPSAMFANVQNYVFPFIKQIGEGKDTAFSRYMKDTVFLIPTPKVLAKVVDGIDAMDMNNKDIMGDVYEYLLGKIAAAGENGQFRTPRHIIRMMVELMKPTLDDKILETGKRTCIDLGIHGMNIELVRLIGRMKYRSSYGQNLLQHSREVANISAILASELGLNPKIAKRAGLLHDIGKVSEMDPELPHALLGMKLAEQYKEKPEICNAVGAHHEETEMTSIYSPLVLVGDAISGARPGARREVIESYIKRLKGMEDLAASYHGVTKSYAIQAGRELRVIVGAEDVSDDAASRLSADIAQKIQDEMTYPGQVKITVIRETRSVAYAK